VLKNTSPTEITARLSIISLGCDQQTREAVSMIAHEMVQAKVKEMTKTIEVDGASYEVGPNKVFLESELEKNKLQLYTSLASGLDGECSPEEKKLKLAVAKRPPPVVQAPVVVEIPVPLVESTIVPECRITSNYDDKYRRLNENCKARAVVELTGGNIWNSRGLCDSDRLAEYDKILAAAADAKVGGPKMVTINSEMKFDYRYDDLGNKNEKYTPKRIVDAMITGRVEDPPSNAKSAPYECFKEAAASVIPESKSLNVSSRYGQPGETLEAKEKRKRNRKHGPTQVSRGVTKIPNEFWHSLLDSTRMNNLNNPHVTGAIPASNSSKTDSRL